MKYAYYPGCSAHSTARDMHESCLAVSKALGIELNEIKGWTCCGASSAHQTDRELAASLASANLVKAGRMGMDMVVNCAACYNRSKVANYEMVHSEDMRRAVAESLGEPYDGSVPVRHFVEILLKDVGVAALRKKITSPLTGLKAAAYYGCYLVRPPEATNFDDPENPTILERLIEVTGAENVEWSGKVGLLRRHAEPDAHGDHRPPVGCRHRHGHPGLPARSASSLPVPCVRSAPDVRQADMEKLPGQEIRYARRSTPTQLLGLALGMSPRELGFDRLMVDPAAVLKARKEAVPSRR